MQKMAAVILVGSFALAGIAMAAEKEGTIQSINPAMQEITLDDGSRLTWDRNTRITVEGKQGKLEDLKQGERVRVSFEERNGKAVAVILEVGE
ncbi:MAG TPA: DUF1344 domain-containing protein [Candidatus Methylomirabilis sp.]|nr:DUF1344 domain-containing protein [Candidatus Methylomirabilis sp.]